MDLGGKAVKGASFSSIEAHMVVVDVSGGSPIVAYTAAYQQTLPEAYADAGGGGKFKLVKVGEQGWRVQVPSTKNPERQLIHTTIFGKAPGVGGAGDNVGRRPVKEVVDLLVGLSQRRRAEVP